MRLPSSIQVYGIHDLRKKNKKEKDTSCVICVGGVRGKTQSQFNTLPMVQEEMKYILYSLQIEHETAKNLKQRNISIAKEFFLVLWFVFKFSLAGVGFPTSLSFKEIPLGLFGDSASENIYG